MIEKGNIEKRVGSHLAEPTQTKDIFKHNYKEYNPFNYYRYGHIKLKGNIIIKYIKNIDNNYYTLEYNIDNKIVELEPQTQTELWYIIELIRSKKNREGYTIEVRDLDTRTVYKKLTLAQTLSELEYAEELELDKKRHKRDRARFVLKNLPTKKTKFIRGVDPKTW